MRTLSCVRNIKKSWAVVPVLFILFFDTSGVNAGDDFQYWSWYTVKVWDSKYVNLSANADLRFFDDASDLGFWLLRPKLTIDAHKNLSFGINYTYLETDTLNSRTKTSEFKYHHRLELEVNPHVWLGKWTHLKNRNRVEFRWIEDKGSDNARLRQLWELDFPVRCVPVLESVYFNNEMFADFNVERINEHRTVPLGITLGVWKKTKLKVFYMIQSKRGTRDWSSNQILGTHLQIAF